MDKQEVFKMIDSTLLKPEATAEDITKLCQDAKKYGFASVCVHPCYVPLCVELMKGSGVKVCTVVGFPMGQNTTAVKAFEAKEAVEMGADELDMVINISALKNGQLDYVKQDMEAVVKAAAGKTVKVILETCYLTDEEKEQACKAALEAGVSFVKTSTGLAKGGATVEDVKLMRRVVQDKCGVKAAGGIRTFEDCVKFIQAGANRIGTGTGAAIAQGVTSDDNSY